MRDKLNPNIERKQHFNGFLVYRDLGYGRTFRAVAREMEVSPNTVCNWAKKYKWDERISQYNTTVATKKEMGALLKVDDPVAQKLVDAMDRVEAIIDSTFVQEASGKFIPQVKPKSVEELTRLITEYRKLLETNAE